MAAYQVVAECAHVTTSGGLRLLYKGAFVPDDCDRDRLQHLVDAGLVKEVKSADDTPLAPNAAIVPDEFAATSGGSAQPDTSEDDETAKQREAAAAKLPTDGTAPDGRASKEVWVEYAVRSGMDRGEAEKASKEDLRGALGTK